jgi:hypothetical protein
MYVQWQQLIRATFPTATWRLTMSPARQMEMEIVVQKMTFAHLWVIALVTSKVTITAELVQMPHGLTLLVRIIAWPTQIVRLILLHIT